MGDLIRVRFHGAAAVAARAGSASDPNNFVPVVPNGLGGVLRPSGTGTVWMYLPIPTFPRFSADTTKINMVRIFGEAGPETELVGFQLFREGRLPPITSFRRFSPDRRIENEPFGEEMPRAWIGSGAGVGIGEFAIAVGLEFEFKSATEGHAALWSAEVDFEETS